MRTPLYLICILAFWACNNENDNAAVLPPDPPKKYDSLISRFRKMSLDTLKVFSPQDQKGEYEGVMLDSSLASQLRKIMNQDNLSEQLGIHSVYRFTVDDKHMGLVARTPSHYVSSSVNLFMLRQSDDSLKHIGQLADYWGDAGDLFTKTTWLFRSGKELRGFVHEVFSHSNMVDNPKDTTETIRHTYYLLNLGYNKVDTLSKDSVMLLQQFGSLLR
jgi:hypothetical protein